MSRHITIALALMVANALPAFAQDAATAEPEAGAPFIAGVVPSERPAGAQVIEVFDKTDAWYAQALTGVSEPYPASLHFLEDQGAWFTPFIHPGMTHPYDIRGWHKAE